MADATFQQGSVYRNHDGDLIVPSGSSIDVETGGWFKDAGTITNPLGYTTGNTKLVAGVSTVTGSAIIALTGTLTNIISAWATLGTDPGTGAGNPHTVSVLASGTNLTIKVWQDDVSAATDASAVYYGAVGSSA